MVGMATAVPVWGPCVASIAGATRVLQILHAGVVAADCTHFFSYRPSILAIKSRPMVVPSVVSASV